MSKIPSDDFFIEQINVKSEEFFHELFIRFRNYLVVFAMRRIEKQDAAEDVVQEVFLALWESDKKFNSYQGLKAYLYDSVQNKCLNYLKHKNVENKYLSYALHQNADSESDYNLMQEEIYRELYQAVKSLPEKSRCVFELHLEGKKNDEIAVLLKISPLTVKSHKQNALHYLKKRMSNLYLFYLFFMKRKFF